MQSYTLYNDDVACAQFIFANGLIREYHPIITTQEEYHEEPSAIYQETDL